MAVPAADVTALYLATCRVAYAQTQLAISPAPPFAISDRPFLRKQANEVANAAKHLRGRDPAEVQEPAFADANSRINTVQDFLSAVHAGTGENTDAPAIYGAVAAATAAVRAL